MENKEQSLKVIQFILVLAASVIFIYVAKGILFPLVIALIFAILLLPIVNFLVKSWRFQSIIAISSAIVVVLGILVLIFYLFGRNIGIVFQNLPEIKDNLHIHYGNLQEWISQTLHLNIDEQSKIIKKTMPLDSFFKSFATNSNFGDITNLIMNFILVPIYCFLILHYRLNLMAFLEEIFRRKEGNSLKNLVHEISTVLRSYIVGLLIEMLFVAVLTSLGLWMVGVKYFIFLGILTAFLNLIPYIGILVSCTISILLTIVGSTDLNLVGGIILVNVVVQLIDNNILVPKIVGSKVSINALASMVGIIIGGTIAGVGGMFLAIPILAVLNVISLQSRSNKAFSILIGEKSK